jgi:hypothetical protein
MLSLAIAEISAQSPPPPPPSSTSGSSHGSTTNQTPSGGSAPIGSGHIILLGMGAIYVFYKMYYKREITE